MDISQCKSGIGKMHGTDRWQFQILETALFLIYKS